MYFLSIFFFLDKIQNNIKNKLKYNKLKKMKKIVLIVLLIILYLIKLTINSNCEEGINPKDKEECHRKTLLGSDKYCCYFEAKIGGLQLSECWELDKEDVLEKKDKELIKNINALYDKKKEKEKKETEAKNVTVTVKSLICKSSFEKISLRLFLFLIALII